MVKKYALNYIRHKKTTSIARKSLNCLAGAVGLEPTTCGFGDRRSTNWSYAPADETNYA